MIYDTLNNADRYASLHPLFPRAIEFLRSKDLPALEPGIHVIIDKQMFAIIEQVSARVREAAKLECHRKYIDIQLVLQGRDEMGWKSLSDCQQPLDAFNSEKDIQFFTDHIDTWIATHANEFCIFFPQDAHAPLVGTGKIRKVVMKIAVDPI
ncbi:MAG: YhcH/YjgK/YiaL family protein [Gammaproteobacteria bacterium]|nr:YhcH/YjgK/YiaL family protein [Gammaproteobacteria bacterium]